MQSSFWTGLSSGWLRSELRSPHSLRPSTFLYSFSLWLWCSSHFGNIHPSTQWLHRLSVQGFQGGSWHTVGWRCGTAYTGHRPFTGLTYQTTNTHSLGPRQHPHRCRESMQIPPRGSQTQDSTLQGGTANHCAVSYFKKWIQTVNAALKTVHYFLTHLYRLPLCRPLFITDDCFLVVLVLVSHPTQIANVCTFVR